MENKMTPAERTAKWRIDNPDKYKLLNERRYARGKEKRRNATKLCIDCGDEFKSFGTSSTRCPECYKTCRRIMNVVYNRNWQQTDRGREIHRKHAREHERRKRLKEREENEKNHTP